MSLSFRDNDKTIWLGQVEATVEGDVRSFTDPILQGGEGKILKISALVYYLYYTRDLRAYWNFGSIPNK